MDYLDVIALGATNCSVIKCIGIGKGEVLIKIIHLVLFFLVLSLTLCSCRSVNLSVLLMIKLHHNIQVHKVLWIHVQTYQNFFFHNKIKAMQSIFLIKGKENLKILPLF